ncbi:MAG: hypothetical protein H5U05_07040 [Candidatus Aminicenantes bacterium]|nr:hypothetical protein [Candidatus Aminicenantes bacterium]
MIDFIFTLDYEIYGQGYGNLKELVYEPSERLLELFSKYNQEIVFFIEVAELETIEKLTADPTIRIIKNQIIKLKRLGFELGLHIHPQWYGARLEPDKWVLNFDQYNLCLLSADKIHELVNRALNYFRYLSDDSTFTPLSFRAGNWLMSPTERITRVLADAGLKIDSSVYKGGYQHLFGLDYRRAPRHLYYWKFSDDVNTPDDNGFLTELPIYTKMVPICRFMTKRRLALEKKANEEPMILKKRLTSRLRDFLRFYVPLKFDFCRLSLNELKSMVNEIIKKDMESPSAYKPIVLIGHTKDAPDYQSIESFLIYLKEKGIGTTSLSQALKKIEAAETP